MSLSDTSLKHPLEAVSTDGPEDHKKLRLANDGAAGDNEAARCGDMGVGVLHSHGSATDGREPAQEASDKTISGGAPPPCPLPALLHIPTPAPGATPPRGPILIKPLRSTRSILPADHLVINTTSKSCGYFGQRISRKEVLLFLNDRLVGRGPTPEFVITYLRTFRSDLLPRNEDDEISITLTSSQKQLSPFLLGPVPLGPTAPCATAKNVENAWQFSKIYNGESVHWPGRHVMDGEVSKYWVWWARNGYGNSTPQRFPAGKGEIPRGSLSWGVKPALLDYIAARAVLYAPFYADAVEGTPALLWLRTAHVFGLPLVLLDYDGYDAGDTPLVDVLHNRKRKMGHAFVLKGLILGERFWEPEACERGKQCHLCLKFCGKLFCERCGAQWCSTACILSDLDSHGKRCMRVVKSE